MTKVYIVIEYSPEHAPDILLTTTDRARAIKRFKRWIEYVCPETSEDDIDSALSCQYFDFENTTLLLEEVELDPPVTKEEIYG